MLNITMYAAHDNAPDTLYSADARYQSMDLHNESKLKRKTPEVSRLYDMCFYIYDLLTLYSRAAKPRGATSARGCTRSTWTSRIV
jgi:hypothetical protein